MTHLLDGNVLVALVVADHVHHDDVSAWFARRRSRFATSPITQGTLVRFLVRAGIAGAAAQATLSDVVAHRRHEFWPDSIGFESVHLGGVLGHRQVTDAYLAGLARARGGRVVTLDRGLATLHDDVAELVPRGQAHSP